MDGKITVVVKERDEWSDLAEFMGQMIVKYASEINFDELPDPERFLVWKEIKESILIYRKLSDKMKLTNK